MAAKAPTIPAPTTLRPAPAVTIGVDAAVVSVAAGLLPVSRELVGFSVVAETVVLLAIEDTVPFL